MKVNRPSKLKIFIFEVVWCIPDFFEGDEPDTCHIEGETLEQGLKALNYPDWVIDWDETVLVIKKSGVGVAVLKPIKDHPNQILVPVRENG